MYSWCMEPPLFQIHRNGDLFRVGNEEVGYKTFRLKVSRGGRELTLDRKATEEIASRTYGILQKSQLSFPTLANTKVTSRGIQTEGNEGGKACYITKDLLPEFEETYNTITRLAKAQLLHKGESLPAEDSSATDGETSVYQRRVPLFLMKIYEKFEKTFAPRKFNERHTAYAETLVSKSPAKIQELRDFRMDLALQNPDAANFEEAGSKFNYVPAGFLKTEEEEHAELRSRTIAAETAVRPEFEMYKRVPKFQAGEIEVQGYKIHSDKGGKERVREGRVIPTAFMKAGGKEGKRDRLLNIYTASDGTQRVLRSGVVDSREKAKEFVIAAKRLHETSGGSPPAKDRPLRIISQQLNSPETEGKMIQNQHMQLSALDHEIEDVEIAHINTPCNRICEYARILEKRGIEILKGEPSSRHQNIEGMARYLIWLAEDLKGMSEDEALEPFQRAALKQAVDALDMGEEGVLNKIKDALRQISSLHAEIRRLEEKANSLREERRHLSFAARIEVDQEIKSIQKEAGGKRQEIEAIRKTLVSLGKKQDSPGLLQQAYSVLKDEVEYKILSGPDPLLREVRQSVMLYRKLLGNHYMRNSLPKSELMERGQELMLFQILNHRLGVVGGVNCKSGLDRTGFLFAMILSLIQCPEGLKVDLASNWDQYTRELNRKMRELDYDTGKLYQWLDEPANPELKRIYRAILDFRLQTCHHLLNVSLPITAISTGLIGLKWGKGFSENLMPLNFIPPVVQVVNKDGTIDEVQIIRYAPNGRVEGLTETGHRLLTQLSPRRGT